MTESLTVAGALVPPGERRDLAPLVSESYTGDRTTLPMAVVNGVGEGPTAFVTAAIHGDEINGIAICRHLLAALDAATLRGAVIVVPIANVLGAQIRSRYLPDRRDLNRAFPGTSRGSTAARIARILHDDVMVGAAAGIDLHTAANRRTNVPQLRIDTSDAEAARLAAVFGAPYVLDAALRPGSLRDAASQKGVPVLTYEAGEPLRFDEEAIQIGVEGILRVLAAMDMVDAGPAPAPPPLVMHASTWVRADRGGILELHVDTGDEVVEGQELWTTTSPLGAERATVESPVDGVVIGGTTIPLVAPGDAVLHVGIPGEDRPAHEDDPTDEEDVDIEETDNS